MSKIRKFKNIILFVFFVIFLILSINLKNNDTEKEKIETKSETIEKEDGIVDVLQKDEFEEKKLVFLEISKNRANKKPFGIFITKENSPIQPERFSGFHTGTDFEVFENEMEKDVEVRAVCDGKIVLKKMAQGYGGVLAQSCWIENEPVVVVYGHLDLESIKNEIGHVLGEGEFIGFLGKAFSSETDGERKHLHLGVRRGTEVNITGYVRNKEDLSLWLDPCELFCK